MNDLLQNSRFRSLRHHPLMISLGLALLTFAVYWRVGTFDFINYDDNDYVTENSWVQMGLCWTSLRWAFTTTHAANWHPLTWISHIVDVQLFGLWAGPHHLVSVLFHILNTIVLFLVFHRATGEIWKCAFVAALFAVHPLHIQSVAWVAERKDVLSTLFLFITIGLYVLYVQEKRPLYLWSAVCSMALGLMCKPMLVTLPAVLALLDYWPLRRKWTPAVLVEKFPFAVLACISSVVTFFAQKDAVMAFDKLPLPGRLINAVVAYFAYIYKMFWPVHLAVFYPHPYRWPAWLILVSIPTLIAISLLVLFTYKRHPYMLAGWAWYLGILVPTIGIVQVGSQAFADRYTYVPLLGLFIMLAWGIPDFLKWTHLSPDLAPALALLAVGLCLCASGFQLSYWRNSITLFERAVQVIPVNQIAEMNLGAALTTEGRLDEAISHYEKTLKLDPSHASIYFNYGLTLAAKGNLDGAIQRFDQAIKILPHYFKAHSNIANSLVKAGRIREAIPHYQEAIRLDPNNSVVHFNYAYALLAAGSLDSAERQFRKSLKLDYNNVEAHDNLALVLSRKGRFDEAFTEQAMAVQLRPAHFSAEYNFAAMLAKRGSIPEAIFHYRQALLLRPDSIEALNNLALILATTPDTRFRNGLAAVALAERALDLTHRLDAISWNNAAAAYAETMQFDRALAASKEALRLAKEAGQNEFANSIKARIELYERGNAKPISAP